MLVVGLESLIQTKLKTLSEYNNLKQFGRMYSFVVFTFALPFLQSLLTKPEEASVLETLAKIQSGCYINTCIGKITK